MMNELEKKTREERIDKKLESCGWQIVNFDPKIQLTSYTCHAVREYPTQSGPVDYALFYEGIIIGVIEAKRLSLGPQNVLIQAQRYAQGISQSSFNFDGFRVPFIYSTNGEIFWFQDILERNSYSRRIANFHRPEALNEMLKKDLQVYRKWFELHPNEHDRIRPYQINATKAIEQAITQGKRKIFLAMATGTGKTFTNVSQIYRLMKSGLALRILFLVDRRALAAQAVFEFNSFEAELGMKFDKVYEVYSQRFRREDVESMQDFNPKELPESYLAHPKMSHAFVYISTIQRMRINLFGLDKAFETSEGESEEEEVEANKLDIRRAFRGDLSADFREAVKNWKDLDAEARGRYVFVLPEEEREKVLNGDEFPMEDASELIRRIGEHKEKVGGAKAKRKKMEGRKQKT